jgi:hypothetical protein
MHHNFPCSVITMWKTDRHVVTLLPHNIKLYVVLYIFKKSIQLWFRQFFLEYCHLLVTRYRIWIGNWIHWVLNQGLVHLEGLGKLKKFNNLVGTLSSFMYSSINILFLNVTLRAQNL